MAYIDRTPLTEFEQPFPNPKPISFEEDKDQFHFELHGAGDDTPGRKAYFVQLVAKPGKEEALQAFLRDVNRGVDDEPLTGPWFGLRFNKSTFFIFETFPDFKGREAHNVGPGGQQFLRGDELKDMLAYPAQSYKMDVMHGKYGVIMGQPVTPVIE
ncbi:hypothetical protein BKA61DRAFT_560116 [Leptodontidium sp. MPI-SDFR-AT-0119]|nr:hypothetical protein BKA61DRAFT_529901 [Leptodontidium sp. MPI-SDFR-AT-0119]KAH6704205.1 hypothetical protein BKA61DRAFT_560116 [Leptodontidium sp. MPI-SDFR-AT-0119]